MIASSWLNDFIIVLQVAQKQEDFCAALKALAEQFDFEWYGFLDAYGSDVRVLTNYPGDWRQLYLSRNYAAIDPLVKAGRIVPDPFVWATEAMPFTLAANQVQFMGEASAFGIRSGVTIPIPAGLRHTSVLALASSSAKAPSSSIETSRCLRDAAVYFRAFALNRARHFLVGPDFGLTPAECKVLLWSSHGLVADEIATEGDIKVATVRFHLRNARTKLGANSLQQAIGIASSRGII